MKGRTIALALLAAATAAAPSPAQAASLFPDLRTLAPSELRFDMVSYEGRTFRALRFSNTVWNPGRGALELRGAIGGGGAVTQRIFNDAGGYSDVVVAQDFVYHPTHRHFHFPDFAEYQLWTRADWDAWIASGRTATRRERFRGAKVSFCLMDTGRIQALAGSPSSARYTTCGETSQGISVGWGDTYGASLDEQWIELGSGGLANGEYVLRSVADPLNRLYESASKADAAREGAPANEAVVRFRVKQKRITVF